MIQKGERIVLHIDSWIRFGLTEIFALALMAFIFPTTFFSVSGDRECMIRRSENLLKNFYRSKICDI